MDVSSTKPLTVFFTVGTDHHRFDRLVGWADEWAAQSHEPPMRCVIQYGTATRPVHGEPHDWLGYEAFETQMATAEIAVTQGGPGSVAAARRSGKRPLVVPRRKELREHVNDHQVAFAEHLSRIGAIELAQTRESLFELLSRAMRDPGWLSVAEEREGHVADTVAAFAALVDPLIDGDVAPRG
jgi:UDP-N-acetylglucosamine transferase subunit ALG13